MTQTVKKKYGSIVVGGSEYIESTILPMLRELQHCSSISRWEYLFTACISKWERDGQHNFIQTFTKSYACLKWRSWYPGSLPIVNIGVTNNPMESFNRMIKHLVSRHICSYRIYYLFICICRGICRFIRHQQ